MAGRLRVSNPLPFAEAIDRIENPSVLKLLLKAFAEHGPESPGQPSPSPITVRDLVARYVQSVEFRALRDSATEERRLRLHVVRLLGDHQTDTLTHETLNWYRERRRQETCVATMRKTMPATRNREVRRIMVMMAWAKKGGLIQESRTAGAAMEREENQRRTCPSLEEVERVVAACASPRARGTGLRLQAMVALAFSTGMRRGEIVNLRLDQLDPKEGLIELHALDTKTRRPRITILSERAAALVRAYLDARKATSTLVFCSASGRPISPRNFLRDYKAACERAGVTGVCGETPRLHDLRAGFVGHQLELGTPARVIMDMTGHRNHSVFDRYTRVKRSWILEAKNRADGAAAKTSPRTRRPKVKAPTDITDGGAP